MKASMKVENADSIEMTLTVTMKVGDWKQLRDQLNTGQWPAWEFSRCVTGLILQAEKHFRPEPKEDKAA